MITKSLGPFARPLVAIVALSSVALASPPPQASAVAFVRTLYQIHFGHKQRWDLTFKQYKNRLAAPLLEAFAAEDTWQAAHSDEVGNLDGDPLTDSQDTASRYTIGTPVVDGTDVLVPVAIRVGPESRTVRVRLTPDGASWKIANVLYSEGPDLMAILKMPHDE